MDIKYIFILIQFVIIVMLLSVNDANLALNEKLSVELHEHHEHHCNTDGWEVPKEQTWTIEDLINPHPLDYDWWY